MISEDYLPTSCYYKGVKSYWAREEDYSKFVVSYYDSPSEELQEVIGSRCF